MLAIWHDFWYNRALENEVETFINSHVTTLLAEKGERFACPDYSKKRDRNDYLLRQYGLGVTDYNDLMVKQKGCCKICNDPPADGKHLYVDHDHKSGDVRGLLCGLCNTMLGFARDNLSILEAGKQYILDYRKRKLSKSNQ